MKDRPRSIGAKASMRLMALPLAACLLTAGAPSVASSRTSNQAQPSRILFSAGRDLDLFSLRSDGSGRRRITSTSGYEYDAEWSPDQKLIVTSLTPQDRSKDSELYLLEADGSARRRLTRNTVAEGFPSWSPGGSRIVFARNTGDGTDLYVMGVDGDNVRRVTKSPSEDYDPKWSPNGKWIAFTSARTGRDRIFLMRPDGSRVHQLTSKPGIQRFATWSPGSRRLAFEHPLNDESTEIRICSIGGKCVSGIGYRGDGAPEWSSNGKRIVVTHRAPNGMGTGLFAMRPSGNDRKRIYDQPATPLDW